MNGGAECFVAWGAECFVPGGIEHFVGTSLVVLSAYHHPNLPHGLLHSCKWGQCSPHEHFSLTCLGITMA